MPILVLTIYLFSTKCKFTMAIYGFLSWILICLILENFFNFLVLSWIPIANVLNNYKILYALYVCICAACFEEIGRYIILSKLNKQLICVKDAIAFGIGYGISECILLVGFQYIVFSIFIILNHFNIMSIPTNITNLINGLNFQLCIIGIVERILSMILQLCYSLIIFLAVKCDKKIFLISFFIHIIVDFFAGLYQIGIFGIMFVEFLEFVFTIITIFVTLKLIKVLNNGQ